MVRGVDDHRLLGTVGRLYDLAGEPSLVSSHHADVHRWGGLAVRVTFDRSGRFVHERTVAARVAGVPVPEPCAVVADGGCDATVARWVPSGGVRDVAEVGEALGRLHRAGRPPAPLLTERLTVRWARLGCDPASLPAALTATVASAADVVADAEAVSGRVSLHGDVHERNIVWGVSGPVLVDWELASAGPAWWDVAHLLVDVERYGRDPADGLRLLDGYGTDPRGDRRFERLCRVREAMMTFSAVHRATVDPTPVRRAEAARRLAFWDGDRACWKDHDPPVMPPR